MRLTTVLHALRAIRSLFIGIWDSSPHARISAIPDSSLACQMLECSMENRLLQWGGVRGAGAKRVAWNS
jgi:hypothetical protein